MAEVELTDIFKNRWVKRIIFLGIMGLLIWKFTPDIIYRFTGSNLERSARDIVRVIKSAKSFNMCHENDNYAADFNLKDNTFSLVYPLVKKPGQRKIIEEMKILPEGIEIIKCTFTPLIIKGVEDPDENKIVYRISFDKDGNAHLNDSAVWVGNRKGEVRKIWVINPLGKVKIIKQRKVD